jgi:hypothetical protein
LTTAVSRINFYLLASNLGILKKYPGIISSSCSSSGFRRPSSEVQIWAAILCHRLLLLPEVLVRALSLHLEEARSRL